MIFGQYRENESREFKSQWIIYHVKIDPIKVYQFSYSTSKT